MLGSDLPLPVHEGEILAGKYRIDRILGAGGMGVVVAATHLELGQRVAIKFLLPAAMQGQGARERFTREARAAATLRSDHVAHVVDVGTLDNGAPYMIMEFLEGCDLGQLLAKHGPLRVDEAVGYVLQACDAVSEAHASGIVHRDLKPGNLFLTRKPNGAAHIKVLDFGISKSTKVGSEEFSLTKTTDVMGSPLYMAPEQVRSARDVDERTDIWAMGVILYELLTGRVPFPAQNVPQLCALILEKEPEPIAVVRPDLPFELVAAVQKCLAKDPAQRFSSIGDLMRVLFPFAPAPAASGLTRSVSPGFASAASASVGSLERPSQEWAETLAGPPPPVIPPRVIPSDVGSLSALSNALGLESSGPPTASVTLPGTAAAVRRRFLPLALALVALLLVAAVTVAGLVVLSSRAMRPAAPSALPAVSSVQPPVLTTSAPTVAPPASMPASDSHAPEMPVSPAPAQPTAPPTLPARTAASPATSKPPPAPPAPPATTTAQPPSGDLLPDERK